MRVTVEWYGHNYSPTAEDFPSLADAADTFQRRATSINYHWPCFEDGFEAIAGPPGNEDYFEITHQGRFTRNGTFRWERI